MEAGYQGPLSLAWTGTQMGAGYPGSINHNNNDDRGNNDRVKVILRVRPPTATDQRRHSPLEFDPAKPNKLTLHRPDAPVAHTEFEFDRVLPPGATQQDVYLSGVKDVVDDVLKGYNGTVMAYGQTGAGKTYTLGNIQPQAIGMIPRCAAEIFYQASSDPFHTYSVSMSYIQIYMELIQDLLNPQSDNLVIREDSGNGVFVAGAQEVPVSSLEECLHYLAVGEQNRAFAFTHLNAHSSRSHAVVMLTVVKRRRYLTPAEKQAEKKAEREGVSTHKVKVGKLYLVDLAGSERLKKSKSVGQRATEARSINLSLTTLGMCISARAMDEKHVPFRDSKLTRLLQESLGGNAKTTLLVNVASAQEHADETMQSLSFASRAMCVKNKPVVNERVDYKILHAELQSRMDKENDRASHLEVALSKKEEAMDDAMQAAVANEKARFEAIIASLRRENEQRVAFMHSEMEGVRELAAHERAHRSNLEERIKELEIEKANMAEKHYNHVAMLNAQIADLLERQAEEATAHRQEAQAAAVELSSATAATAQKEAENERLRQEMGKMQQEMGVLASAHKATLVALAKLRQSLEAAMPGAAAAAAPAAAERQHGSSDLPPLAHKPDQGSRRPPFHRQVSEPARSSATAAAAAAAREGRASSPGTVGAVMPAPTSMAATSMAATHGSNTMPACDHLPPTPRTLAPPSAANSARENQSGELSRASTVGEGVAGFSSSTNVQGAGQLGAQAAASDASAAAGRDREAGDGDQDPVVEWAPQTAEMAEAESLQEEPAAAAALESMTAAMEGSMPSVEACAAPYMPPLDSSPTAPQGPTSPQTPPRNAAHTVHQLPLANGGGGPGADSEQLSVSAPTFGEAPTSPPMPAQPLSAFHVRSSPAFDAPGELDSSTGAGVEDLDGVDVAGQQGENGDLGGGTQGLTQGVKRQLAGLQLLAEHLRARVAEAQSSSHAMLQASQAETAKQADEAAGLLGRLNDTTADRDATAADLEATQSELEATRSDLEAATSQLALTAADLEAVREKLEDAELEGTDLNGQATSLRAQVAELQEHLGAKEEQVSDLEHQVQDLQEQLEREGAAKKAVEDHLQSNYSTRLELLQTHVETRKRVTAALTIQQCYRQWRSRVGAQHRAAQIGAGLVMDSMTVLRDGLNNLFSTFMASTREMEASQSLKQRLATAAPILAEQRRQQQQQQAAQNAGPMGKPRNHAAYAASLQEPTPQVRNRPRAASAGTRPQAPRDGGAPPAAAYSRPPAHSAPPSAVPQALMQQQQQQQQQLQPQRQQQGASGPSEVEEEDASAAAFPVPQQHRLARSAGPGPANGGPAKPARAESGRSRSGRMKTPL